MNTVQVQDMVAEVEAVMHGIPEGWRWASVKQARQRPCIAAYAPYANAQLGDYPTFRYFGG